MVADGGGCADDWEDDEVESLACFVDAERDADSAAVVLCTGLDGAVSSSRFVFVRASSVMFVVELSGVCEPLSFLPWMAYEFEGSISLPRNLAILVTLAAGVMVSASPAMRYNGTFTPAHTFFPATPPTGDPDE